MMTRQKAERIMALVEQHEREDPPVYLTAWLAQRLAVTEAKATRLLATARDTLARP